MFSTEKALSTWLKKNIPGHWCRVENVASTGTPDMSYAVKEPDRRPGYPGRRSEGWIELKVDRRTRDPYNTPVKVKLRPAQNAWITKRVHSGGNAWVLIGMADGGLVLVPGAETKKLMVGKVVLDDSLGYVFRKDANQIRDLGTILLFGAVRPQAHGTGPKA